MLDRNTLGVGSEDPGALYVRGDRFERHSRIHQGDLAWNLKAVTEARKMAEQRAEQEAQRAAQTQSEDRPGGDAAAPIPADEARAQADAQAQRVQAERAAQERQAKAAAEAKDEAERARELEDRRRKALAEAEAKGLLQRDLARAWPTDKGFDFLSDLQELFLSS